MTMEKDLDKLVEGYERYTVGEFKVQKKPGDPGMNISKSELEEPKDIDKYRSFLGQLM